jgi:Domain of unknown function (DUF4337)
VPDEQEIELGELQEKVHEAHHDHVEHGDTQAANWTKSIALTTAILAVFAAVGALQAGGLVNEALIDQIKASDTWNEYQASREKTHLYTIGRNTVLDFAPAGNASPMQGAKDRVQRASEYKDQLDKEVDKSKDLSAEAKKLEKESEHKMHSHHMFAYEVALLQVAIALGAVSALTRVKWVWGMSMALGVAGVVLFIIGFLGLK